MFWNPRAGRTRCLWATSAVGSGRAGLAQAAQRTILIEYVQALLHQQGRVQDDQAEAQRQHVVARPHLQKGADGSLSRN